MISQDNVFLGDRLTAGGMALDHLKGFPRPRPPRPRLRRARNKRIPVPQLIPSVLEN